jgi:hypothetical protein
MNRLSLALVVVSLLIPGAAMAQVPSGDSVTGSGTATFFTAGFEGLATPFDFDVHSGPSGENPTGTARLLLSFTDPSCLVVRGGGGASAPSAAMNFANPITGIRIVIQIGGGESGPQLVGASSSTSASDCEFRSLPQTQAEVTSGQIVIVDAPPLPTSKDQCKNGGWRRYGFKSQGACIAFIERGAH